MKKATENIILVFVVGITGLLIVMLIWPESDPFEPAAADTAIIELEPVQPAPTPTLDPAAVKRGIERAADCTQAAAAGRTPGRCFEILTAVKLANSGQSNMTPIEVYAFYGSEDQQ